MLPQDMSESELLDTDRGWRSSGGNQEEGEVGDEQPHDRSVGSYGDDGHASFSPYTRGSLRGGRGSSGGRGRVSQFRGAARGVAGEYVRPTRQPFRKQAEGEEKWQYMVRKKKAQAQPIANSEWEDDMDSDEEGLEASLEDDKEEGEFVESREEWRRKKIGWLCKEIPGLRPTGVVTILNGQRSWITAVDSKQVIEHLLRREEVLRAHRVLKWMMQQPWYEDDYELNTKLANILGRKNKLSRSRELFDTIILNGKVPDQTTYCVLISGYIDDRSSESLDEAFSLYNQMLQLGAYEQPPSLAYSLFQAFTDRAGGAFTRHLDQADALFESIKKKGAPWTDHFSQDMWTVMYTALMHLHGTKGDGERVENLIEEMKGSGLDVSPNVYTAVLRVCAHGGDVEKAEKVLGILAGAKLEWRAYVALIQTYGKAGMPAKALRKFQEMEADRIHININAYEAIIEAMAKAGERESAEILLERAQATDTPSLQSSYNAVMEMYLEKGLLSEIEILFNRMKEVGCRPNHQSYNVLIDSYIKRGQLGKADEVYEGMKAEGGIRPNLKTYSLLLEAFGKAERQEKVKEIYSHLTARKLELPAEAKPFVTEAVGPKKVAYEEKARPRSLVQDQREMLVGVLLGGARIETHDNDRTYEIHFGLDPNTHVGTVMINHLYKTFSDWAQQAPRVETVQDLSDLAAQVSLLQFSTISHGSFRFYAHQYRPDGSPVIPRLIHRWLNPRSLAYWYMYGGSKCSLTGGIILNGSQYTAKELALVVKALKARTIDCEKKKRRSGSVVRFKGKSAMWLWKLMEPHILEELKDSLMPEEKEEIDGSEEDDDVFDDSEDESREENEVGEGEGLKSSKSRELLLEISLTSKEVKESVTVNGAAETSQTAAVKDHWEGLAQAALREKGELVS